MGDDLRTRGPWGAERGSNRKSGDQWGRNWRRLKQHQIDERKGSEVASSQGYEEWPDGTSYRAGERWAWGPQPQNASQRS